MGRKRKFGTHAIGGLNTKTVAHNLEDHELQRCVNTSFDSVGAASPLLNHELLYTGSGQENQGIASVVLNGVQKLFWRSGDKTYVNSTILTGVPDSIGTARFVGDGENVYIVDSYSGDNYVYDGTYTRSHGAPAKPAGEEYSAPGVDDKAAAVVTAVCAITAFTNHATAPQLTIPSQHGLKDGDVVYLRGLSGGTFSTLDDNEYAVTVVSATQFTISEDTSGLGTFTAGNIQPRGPALGMDYRYAASCAVVLPSGEEIESSLVSLWNNTTALGNLSPPPSSDPINLTGTEWVRIFVELDGNPLTGYISPTTGLDYKIVVYRTKGDGDTYYRLREITSSELTSYAFYFADATLDADLGAAWLYSLDANDQPPSATMACICQQIMFLAGVLGHETNLYRSRISGYDYYKPTDYIDVEARITAIASMADRVVVFTQDRIGTYSPIDEIGQFAWSLSPVGTDQSFGICVTEMGVLFARGDGLWLFDGVTSRNLTEHITSEWQARSAAGDSWHIARTPDLVVCCSSQGKLVASTLGGAWKWSAGGDLAIDRVINVCSSADGITLYGLIWGNLYTLFADGQRSLSITSKDYGGWKTWEALQLDVDAYCAGNDFTATVTTNHGESAVISFDGMVRRNRYRAMLPANLRGEYINVKFDGQVTIYGWEILAQ